MTSSILQPYPKLFCDIVFVLFPFLAFGILRECQSGYAFACVCVYLINVYCQIVLSSQKLNIGVTSIGCEIIARIFGPLAPVFVLLVPKLGFATICLNPIVVIIINNDPNTIPYMMFQIVLCLVYFVIQIATVLQCFEFVNDLEWYCLLFIYLIPLYCAIYEQTNTSNISFLRSRVVLIWIMIAEVMCFVLNYSVVSRIK